MALFKHSKGAADKTGAKLVCVNKAEESVYGIFVSYGVTYLFIGTNQPMTGAVTRSYSEALTVLP